MSEFKSALGRLANRVTLPDDPLERLARKRARVQRNRRIGVAALAFAVAAAGVGLGLAALAGSGEGRRPAARHTGYYVEIPDAPDGYDKKGLAILDAETNLPDGTVVDLYFFSADIESPAQVEVRNGRVSIRLWNGFCHETERGLEGTTSMVTVTVSPVSRFVPSGGLCVRECQNRSPPPYQPPSVLAVLGPNFEKLTGDQVVEEEGHRALVASALVQLAAKTCVKKVLYTGSGSFDQVPLDRPIPLPPGPFPKPPFLSCPNPDGALPVEAGDWSRVGVDNMGQVAEAFDAALTAEDTKTLHRLADASIVSFDGWSSTGSATPTWTTNVPSGNYMPAVPRGCGALVALRTAGVTLARSQGESAAVSYLLIVRSDGWKVWGQLPGDGRSG